MTVTTTHRHGPFCDLLEQLELDHGTPVLEWHDWLPTPPPPVPDPDLPAHSGLAATNLINLSVPAGAALNGLVILTASTYGAGNTVVCTDPRITQIATVGDFKVWAGHLVTGDGKDWNDPFTITTAGSNLTADMAVYEPGITYGAVSAVLTDSDKSAPAPHMDDVAGVAVVARSWEFLIAGTVIGAPGAYTPVGTASSTKTRTRIFHWSAGGVLADNPAGDFTADGDSGALQLVTVELIVDEDALEELDPYSWQRNDDRTASLVDYSSTAGRPTPAQNTEPLNGSVTLARYLAGEILPSTGDRYRLTLNPDVADALEVDEDERPRFTGEITDVDIEANGNLSLVKITGLGRRARLTRTPVTINRPQESDGERVRRILAAITYRLPLEVGTIDPGTVQLLPDAPIAVPADQLLESIRTDSLGRLVEHRSGRLDYHDAGHRRGLTSRVTLTGTEHLIRPFSWRQGIGTIINDASATFGPDDDRETVTVTDPVSADPNTGVGPYGASLDTRLAGELDAYALLTDLVGRNSRPAYYLPSVIVDLFRTAGAALPVLLELNHGDKIHAADLPPDGAFTDGDVFVEGTTETANARAWRLDLVVADPALAGAGLRWIDVPRFLRWVDVDPDLTWLDVATITDPYALGTPVADGGDADDNLVGLIVDGGDAFTTSWDYVLSGDLP